MKSNNRSNEQSHDFDSSKMNELLMAYAHEKRFQMRKLFSIYHELSLTDLSNLMNMSKAAVHHHIKIMRKAHLIEVARQEETRGSIKRKYFKLTSGPHRFKIEDLSKIEDGQERMNCMQNVLQTLEIVYQEIEFELNLVLKFISTLQNQIKRLDNITLSDEEQDQYIQLLKKHNTHVRNIFLTDKQYVEYKNLELDFLKQVDQLLSKKTEGNSPYLAILIDMPIKNLMEFKINH